MVVSRCLMAPTNHWAELGLLLRYCKVPLSRHFPLVTIEPSELLINKVEDRCRYNATSVVSLCCVITKSRTMASPWGGPDDSANGLSWHELISFNTSRNSLSFMFNCKAIFSMLQRARSPKYFSKS